MNIKKANTFTFAFLDCCRYKVKGINSNKILVEESFYNDQYYIVYSAKPGYKTIDDGNIFGALINYLHDIDVDEVIFPDTLQGWLM